MLGVVDQGGGAMRMTLGAGLLAVAMGATAASKEAEPVRFHANARVELDAHGVPRQVQVNEKLPPAIRSVVEQQVMQWRFEPARVNGVAMAGVTHVFLDACLAPLPGDGMSVAMNYRHHGPGYASGAPLLSPPRFPPSAARYNQEGSFRVVAQIGEDGRAKIASVETVSGSLKPFEQALRDWVTSMRYLPEEVDGKPIATRVVYPVAFSLPNVSIKQLREEQRDAARQSAECQAAVGESKDPQRPVVLDSPFKLKEAG
jgi:TonB family protein